ELRLISAAVSGGASGAQAGTLSIMASGSEDIVRSFQPYFDAIGSHTFYYGEEPGNSQVAKLVNNMVLGINMNALAEGLKLAKHYGMLQDEVLHLMQVSAGDSCLVRHMSDVSEWSTDTVLTVLMKHLHAAYHEGLKHDIPLPYNSW